MRKGMKRMAVRSLQQTQTHCRHMVGWGWSRWSADVLISFFRISWTSDQFLQDQQTQTHCRHMLRLIKIISQFRISWSSSRSSYFWGQLKFWSDNSGSPNFIYFLCRRMVRTVELISDFQLCSADFYFSGTNSFLLTYILIQLCHFVHSLNNKSDNLWSYLYLGGFESSKCFTIGLFPIVVVHSAFPLQK